MIKCLGKNCLLRGGCKHYHATGPIGEEPIINCDPEFRSGFLSIKKAV